VADWNFCIMPGSELVTRCGDDGDRSIGDKGDGGDGGDEKASSSYVKLSFELLEPVFLLLLLLMASRLSLRDKPRPRRD